MSTNPMHINAVSPTKTSHIKLIAGLVLLLLMPLTSFAVTLQEAKADGLIGEKTDGYVGFVVGNIPSDVRALVNDVNRQRKARYQQVAAQNNLTLQQVTTRAFERATTNTKPGHYLQAGNGNWRKK